jgi:dihydrofolate reductase
MLTAIWAQDKTGLIGKEQTMPWHLPNDLKFFKEQTIHHTIVMGRKTYEGMGKKLLPKRQSIILTSDMAYEAPGALVMHSVADVLAYSKTLAEEVFIVGGATLYREFLPYCERLLKTQIEATFEGDTFFPEIDWQKFELIHSKRGIIDEKNKYGHTFEEYMRKNA